MIRILVTRPEGVRDPLVKELQALSYRVAAVPTVVTRPTTVEWPDLSQFDWIVVTSAAGVEALPAIAPGPRWAAVGQATATALRARGAEPALIPTQASGTALADSLPDPFGMRVLVVRASMADPAVPSRLRQRGARVEEITAYDTVEGPPESAGPLGHALADGDLAAVVFASGSAVRGYMKLGGSSDVPAITIGPRTSAVARKAGFNVAAEAVGPSVRQLAAAVAAAVPIQIRSREVRKDA